MNKRYHSLVDGYQYGRLLAIWFPNGIPDNVRVPLEYTINEDLWLGGLRKGYNDKIVIIKEKRSPQQ